MDDFATYILNENDYIQKMIIAYYMSEKTKIYFDKSIVLRTELARMFMKYARLDVDENLVLTAMLLCNCRKIDNVQRLDRVKSYAKEGAEYLALLGFDQEFCDICEGVNRYGQEKKERRKESDILEVVDQFAGLILRREEREAFSNEEALIVLRERNLKNVQNRYIEDFTLFVKAMESVRIRDTIEVPVIRKLAMLTEREKNIKSLIAQLGNRYSKEIDRLMNIEVKREAERLLYNADKVENNNVVEEIKKKASTLDNAIDTVQKTKKKMQTAHRYTRKIYRNNPNRALFSQEATNRILNHDTSFKFN